VQPDAVADLARDVEHGRADRRHRDRHPRQAGGTRGEIRGHQAQGVVGAAILERLLLLPAAPDRAHRPDVVAQARRRRNPGDAVPALVVGLHLGPEAEVEAPTGRLLEIPGLVRGDRRTAREGHRHRGAELHPLGRQGGGGERQVRAVRVLERDEPVEAGRLRQARRRLRPAQVVVRQLGDHSHRGRPPYPGNGGGGTGAAARGALCSQGGLWYRLGKPREVTAALAHVHA
jgi:hypothetical protein